MSDERAFYEEFSHVLRFESLITCVCVCVCVCMCVCVLDTGSKMQTCKRGSSHGDMSSSVCAVSVFVCLTESRVWRGFYQFREMGDMLMTLMVNKLHTHTHTHTHRQYAVVLEGDTP